MSQTFLNRILLVFFLLPLALSAQEETLPAIPQDFPAAWVGIWQGELDIYSAKGHLQRVPMELQILPLDTAGHYTWTIIYGEDREAGTRPYILKTIDPEKGLYLIDERNSIAMEAYFLHDKLYNRFEVMGNLLLTTTEKRSDELLFEVISGDTIPASTTGGRTVGGEEIPPVKTYPVRIMQRAVLRRQ